LSTTDGFRVEWSRSPNKKVTGAFIADLRRDHLGIREVKFRMGDRIVIGHPTRLSGKTGKEKSTVCRMPTAAMPVAAWRHDQQKPDQTEEGVQAVIS
jgi:hypothetical protein